MIHRAEHKVGCGEDYDKRIPGRNVTNARRGGRIKLKLRTGCDLRRTLTFIAW